MAIKILVCKNYACVGFQTQNGSKTWLDTQRCRLYLAPHTNFPFGKVALAEGSIVEFLVDLDSEQLSVAVSGHPMATFSIKGIGRPLYPSRVSVSFLRFFFALLPSRKEFFLYLFSLFHHVLCHRLKIMLCRACVK
jgi:hypothetical protein